MSFETYRVKDLAEQMGKEERWQILSAPVAEYIEFEYGHRNTLAMCIMLVYLRLLDIT